MTDKVFNWGILGLGNIARSFAVGLQSTPGARLLAGASTSPDRADCFRNEFDVPRCYSSYEELLADDEVHGIYIATRHPLHAQGALACIAAGKHVLMEKPFTINAREAAAVIDAARTRKVTCVEGMWTRFFPLMTHLRQLLGEGAIGEPRMLQADFSFQAEFDPENRLFNPHLGGGALLDVGVYPISLAVMAFGRPLEAVGVAQLGNTGVDEQGAISLRFPGGEVASLLCGTRARSNYEAWIHGTGGRIRIHSRWWVPTAMTIYREGHQEESVEFPMDGNGYNYEAAELMRCVSNGEIESPVMPHSETLAVMQTMDTLRRQWGLVYPMELATRI